MGLLNVEASPGRCALPVKRVPLCCCFQVHDTCLSRAGAELMAAATCLGSWTLALGQVKAIAEQLMAEAGAWLLSPVYRLLLLVGWWWWWWLWHNRLGWVFAVEACMLV
jgi:hypothetical protein